MERQDSITIENAFFPMPRRVSETLESAFESNVFESVDEINLDDLILSSEITMEGLYDNSSEGVVRHTGEGTHTNEGQDKPFSRAYLRSRIRRGREELAINPHQLSE